MINFNLHSETCTTGFQLHATVTPLNPIPASIQGRSIRHNSFISGITNTGLKKIIDRNTSLRIEFGWSFESDIVFNRLMQDCVSTIGPKYGISTYNLISDMRCSWLGFMPLNSFEKYEYEDLSTYSLIIYNNEIIRFQEEVLTYVTHQKEFIQHAISRDKDYRYDYFKPIRTNRDKLETAFNDFVMAIRETIMMDSIPLCIIEESIGCHYLHYPDLFFELVSFNTLKGYIG